VLFKLLFIISIVLTTFSETEIGVNTDHKLSVTEANLIALDEVLNPELDLDSSYTLNREIPWSVLTGYEPPTLSYKGPFSPQLYFVNTYPRAPPIYCS
jgi:hypothetical protein